MNQAVKNQKIASLNDAYRCQMTGCVVTRGITNLGPLVRDIFVRVREYQDFNQGNDPYGEHDFGSFAILGMKILWKIDYYDQDLKGWGHPLDEQCRRQLTIMRAEEY